MIKDNFKKVVCKECGKEFYRITNTHLWKSHQMTVHEYQQKYPDDLIESIELTKSRASKFKGKTYEELYGVEKSHELKEKRKNDAIKQMKNEEQIKLKQEKCGYIPTKKTLQQTRNTKIERGVIKEYNNYRDRAFQHYGEECARCGVTENLVVHHNDFLNIRSDLGNHSVENLTVLCKPCHSKLHNEFSKKQKGFTGLKDVEKGMHYILKGLSTQFGLNLKDENFTDTPKRVARAYYEMFEGINSEETIENILNSSFPSEYDGMVIAQDIKCFSMCPHHFLPVEYIINLGYIPGERVLGISKLSRIVKLLAKQPLLQEDFTKNILIYLNKYISPKGSMVQVKGKHFCMVMRGAEQIDCWTKTSSLLGIFEEQNVRQEFFDMLKL